MAKFNSHDASNYSEHSEMYVIIGDASQSRVNAWQRDLVRRGTPYKAALGRYGNINEWCLVINPRNIPFEPLLWFRDLIDGQESVLVLGPKASASDHRPAVLHFLDGRLPKFLGYFVPLDDDECTPKALAKLDAYTYDPETDTYFVCRP